MKKETKIKIIFLLFTITIIAIGFKFVPVINWSCVFNTIEQSHGFWKTAGNIFIFAVLTVFVGAVFFYFPIMLFDTIPLAGYFILKNKFEKIEYVFDDYLEASITTLVVDGWIEGNAFIAFLKILGAKMLFFILTPILVLFWIIKWVSYGLFRLTKLAV